MNDAVCKFLRNPRGHFCGQSVLAIAASCLHKKLNILIKYANRLNVVCYKLKVLVLQMYQDRAEKLQPSSSLTTKRVINLYLLQVHLLGMSKSLHLTRVHESFSNIE